MHCFCTNMTLKHFGKKIQREVLKCWLHCYYKAEDMIRDVVMATALFNGVQSKFFVAAIESSDLLNKLFQNLRSNFRLCSTCDVK